MGDATKALLAFAALAMVLVAVYFLFSYLSP